MVEIYIKVYTKLYIAQENQNMKFMARRFMEEYKKWGSEIHFGLPISFNRKRKIFR